MDEITRIWTKKRVEKYGKIDLVFCSFICSSAKYNNTNDSQ